MSRLAMLCSVSVSEWVTAPLGSWLVNPSWESLWESGTGVWALRLAKPLWGSVWESGIGGLGVAVGEAFVGVRVGVGDGGLGVAVGEAFVGVRVGVGEGGCGVAVGAGGATLPERQAAGIVPEETLNRRRDVDGTAARLDEGVLDSLIHRPRPERLIGEIPVLILVAEVCPAGSVEDVLAGTVGGGSRRPTKRC